MLFLYRDTTSVDIDGRVKLSYEQLIIGWLPLLRARESFRLVHDDQQKSWYDNQAVRAEEVTCQRASKGVGEHVRGSWSPEGRIRAFRKKSSFSSVSNPLVSFPSD